MVSGWGSSGITFSSSCRMMGCTASFSSSRCWMPKGTLVCTTKESPQFFEAAKDKHSLSSSHVAAYKVIHKHTQIPHCVLQWEKDRETFKGENFKRRKKWGSDNSTDSRKYHTYFFITWKKMILWCFKETFTYHHVIPNIKKKILGRLFFQWGLNNIGSHGQKTLRDFSKYLLLCPYRFGFCNQ